MSKTNWTLRDVDQLLRFPEESPAITADGILQLSATRSVPYDPWLDLSSTDSVREALTLGVAHAIAALSTGPAAVDATRANIYDLARASWQAFCPLRRDSRVLDYGCGLGALSRALARRCATVIGMDACYERLMVNAAVNRESGTSNVLLAYGGLESLSRFADRTFDGLVVNGVLEWVPEQVDGPPREAQILFLRECRRVLRPDGWLYIGIENRWGFRYYLGRRDEHVGLRFSTLMPRWAADRYSRAFRGRPYRTYTHGRRATERLVGESGFAVVNSYTPAPDYRHFELIIPAQGDPAKAGAGGALDVHKSWKRRLVESRRFFRSFAPSLSVIASPEGHVIPSWLDDLARNGTLPNHAYVKYDQASFWYEAHGAWRVRELSLSDESDGKQLRVAALATQLRDHPDCPAALRTLSLRRFQGFTWLDRPAVHGSVLVTLPPDQQTRHLDAVFEAIRRVHGLGRTLTDSQMSLRDVVADYAPNREESLPPEVNQLFDDVIRLIERRPARAPLLMHGDCSAKNIVVTSTQAELIDWEWARVVDFAGYDILKLAWHHREDPRRQPEADPVDRAIGDKVAREWFEEIHPKADWPTAVCVYWLIRSARALTRCRLGGMPSASLSNVVQPGLESAWRWLSRGTAGQ